MIYDYYAHLAFGRPVPIELVAGIENLARVSVGDHDKDLQRYSVWQLQQLRRAARCLTRMWCRDDIMRGRELLAATERLLRERGAWNDSPPEVAP
jgi:hypothetical protein